MSKASEDQQLSDEKTIRLTDWLLGILAVVVSGTVIAVGVGFFTKLDVFAAQIGSIQTSMATLKSDIEWIKFGVSDMYRKSAAEEKHTSIDRRAAEQQDRINRLDDRVSDLEGRRNQ